MKLKPIYDRLVVKRNVIQTVSAGGILMAMSDPVKEPEGTVIAIGHDVDLKVGDKVLFTPKAGTEIKVDGEELLVMRETDVIAALT